MNLVYAAVIAALMGFSLYLLLSRHIVRIIFGVMVLSAGVNLTIFVAGRVGPTSPPVLARGDAVLQAGAANPLPQALVLTAIVIGFALVAFTFSLVLKAFRSTGSADMRTFTQAEELGWPYDGEEKV